VTGNPELEVFPQKLKLMLAPPVWRVLQSTLSVSPFSKSIPLNEGPLIFACLHRDIIGSILYVRSAKPWLLVSGSDDGLILVRTLGQKNYNFIRGATGENGGRALVKLRQTLEAGHHIGLAVDGPKGPFGAIHPGVFQLAKMTGATIVPLLPEIKPAIVLGTWDRTVVPYLFSGITVKVGPLMRLARDAGEDDFNSLREKLSLFFRPQEGS
jgi:lysophospholipid acyltransferase (LPLAT)-like uncharacterized protein